MKFQPGQSGNPAGRPLGARNKKTIAREEKLAERAEKEVDRIAFLAGGGHAAAMRVCAEWLRPGGNSRALALELPRVTCADDAQAAFDMVIAEFGNGAITVRELPIMLGSVDRMARVAERIQQNREAEKERYKALRVHGVHPDMIPKPPPGWTDPMESFLAAIERGEDQDTDDTAASAEILDSERLYSPVNSDAASLPRAAAEGGSPERSEGETGGGLLHGAERAVPNGSESDGLYFSVNSEEAPSQSETDLEGEAISTHEVEAASETLAPSLARAAGEGGDPGLDPGEPGGGLPSDANTPEEEALYPRVNFASEREAPPPGAADAAPPSSCGRGINDGEPLYSPVNSRNRGSEISDQERAIFLIPDP